MLAVPMQNGHCMSVWGATSESGSSKNALISQNWADTFNFVACCGHVVGKTLTELTKCAVNPEVQSRWSTKTSLNRIKTDVDALGFAAVGCFRQWNRNWVDLFEELSFYRRQGAATTREIFNFKKTIHSNWDKRNKEVIIGDVTVIQKIWQTPLTTFC